VFNSQEEPGWLDRYSDWLPADDVGSGVRFPAGAGNFSFHYRIQTGSGAPIQWVPGALFPGIKWPGREADCSHPPSAEVKNAWCNTSTSQYVFMTWCLVKHRENFTFTFTFTVPRKEYFTCIIFVNSSYL
jgi:hypothetical protein